MHRFAKNSESPIHDFSGYLVKPCTIDRVFLSCNNQLFPKHRSSCLPYSWLLHISAKGLMLYVRSMRQRSIHGIQTVFVKQFANRYTHARSRYDSHQWLVVDKGFLMLQCQLGPVSAYYKLLFLTMPASASVVAFLPFKLIFLAAVVYQADRFLFG